MVAGWSFFPLCPLWCQLIIMIPEFIVGDGNLLSRYGWICSSSSSEIKSSFVLSWNSYCLTSLFSMSCSCLSIRWLFSWWLFIWWIWSYGSSNWTWFDFGRGREMFAWGGPVFLDVYLFLLKSFVLDPCLWLFWRICYLGSFACM